MKRGTQMKRKMILGALASLILMSTISFPMTASAGTPPPPPPPPLRATNRPSFTLTGFGMMLSRLRCLGS
jgi:hypothetical protein